MSFTPKCGRTESTTSCGAGEQEIFMCGGEGDVWKLDVDQTATKEEDKPYWDFFGS